MVEEEMCPENLFNVLEQISHDSFIFNHGAIFIMMLTRVTSPHKKAIIQSDDRHRIKLAKYFCEIMSAISKIILEFTKFAAHVNIAMETHCAFPLCTTL